MANWTPEPQPFGPNHVPSLSGTSSVDGATTVPVAVDPATGRVLTSTTGSITASTLPDSPQNIFRDTFTAQDTTNWTFTTDPADLLYNGGNVASASYLSIAKSALVADTYTEIITNNNWPISILTAAGMTISQRIPGQHFAFDLVGVDNTTGLPINNPTVVDMALSNTGAVVLTNVVTFTTSVANTLLPGDIVVIYGCTDPRMNVGESVVTGVNPTANTFTVANTIANGTYTVGTTAFVRFNSIANYAKYIMGYMFTGVSASNDSTFSSNGARQPEIPASNQISSSTTAAVANENGLNYSGLAYTDAFRAAQEFTLKLNQKHAQYTIRAVDSNAIPGSTVTRSHNIPVQTTNNFKLRFRSRNFPNLAVPNAPITAAVKTASTTATLTVPSHGLTSSDWIAIVGIKDQVNFANQTTAVQATVLDANTITVVFGVSASASSYGGFVMRVQGQNALPSTTSSSIQTYALTADSARLNLVFAATPSTPVVGEVWTLYGLVDSTNTNHPELNGRYKVALFNTTTFTLELTPLDSQNISAVPSSPTNCGGGLIKNTEFRIHFCRAENTNPSDVEIVGGDGNSSFANAIPVQPTNTPNMSTLTTVSTVTSMTQMGGFILKDTLLNFAQEDSWANAVRDRIS